MKTINTYIICDQEGNWEQVRAENHHEAIKLAQTENPINYVFLKDSEVFCNL